MPRWKGNKRLRASIPNGVEVSGPLPAGSSPLVVHASSRSLEEITAVQQLSAHYCACHHCINVTPRYPWIRLFIPQLTPGQPTFAVPKVAAQLTAGKKLEGVFQDGAVWVAVEEDVSKLMDYGCYGQLMLCDVPAGEQLQQHRLTDITVIERLPWLPHALHTDACVGVAHTCSSQAGGLSIYQGRRCFPGGYFG